MSGRPFTLNGATPYDEPVRQPWEVEYKEVEILPDGLLGEGYFGLVYKAKWREMEVCVKYLKNVRDGAVVNYWKEVSILSKLRFPHLVQFLGACTHPEHLCIVTEYMAGGSLYHYLHRLRLPLEVGDAWRIARQIALGMNYLHSHRPPVLHRDLSSSNILLDNQLCAKIGDFGLSRSDPSDISGFGGNMLYVAPESFLQQETTTASDAYSYGILIYELFTGRVPYADTGLSPALIASKVATEGLRPKIQTGDVPPEIEELIRSCWTREPKDRPTFRSIIATLSRHSNGVVIVDGGGGGGNGLDEETTSPFLPSSPSKHGDVTSPPSLDTAVCDIGSTGGQDNTPPSDIVRDRRKKNRVLDLERILVGKTSGLTPEQKEELQDMLSSFDTYGQLDSHLDHQVYSFVTLLVKLIPSIKKRIDEYRDKATMAARKKRHNSTEKAGNRGSETQTASAARGPSSSHSLSPSSSSSSSTSTASSSSLPSSSSPSSLPSSSSSSSKTTPSPSTSSSRSPSSSSPDDAPKDFVSVPSGGAGARRSDWEASDHVCSPGLTCRWYPRRFPLVGEVVMCRVVGFNEHSASFELLAYGGFRGMATLNELSRRRIRSISKLLRVGKRESLRVIRVDSENGFCDLGKKTVFDLDLEEAEKEYQESKAVDLVVRTIAEELEVCVTCMYVKHFWPMLRRNCSSTYRGVRAALVEPLSILPSFQPCSCFSAGTDLHLTPSPRVLPFIEKRCRYCSTDLDLSRLGLSTLPRDLDKDDVASRIQSLNLEDNPLESLPPSISSLTNLLELDVNSCRLSSLPSELSRCVGLKRLYLYGNQLTTIPEVIWELNQLEWLNLSHNQIKHLPDNIGELTAVSELTLSHNLLNSLPDSLVYLTELHTLDVSSNTFTFVPPVLCDLPSLRSLEMKHNQIAEIPIALTKCLYLEWLDFSHNALRRLPEEMVRFARSGGGRRTSGNGNGLNGRGGFNGGASTPLSSGASSASSSPKYGEDKKTPTSLYLVPLGSSPVHNPLYSRSDSAESQQPYSFLGSPGKVRSHLRYLDVSYNPGLRIPPALLEGLSTLREFVWIGCCDMELCDESDGEDEDIFLMEPTLDDFSGGVDLSMMSLQRSGSSLSVPGTTFSLSPSDSQQNTNSSTGGDHGGGGGGGRGKGGARGSGDESRFDTWSCFEVGTWLASQGFPEYASSFEENEIDGSCLEDLDKSDLRDLGVTKLGHQKQILKFIRSLILPPSSSSPASSPRPPPSSSTFTSASNNNNNNNNNTRRSSSGRSSSSSSSSNRHDSAFSAFSPTSKTNNISNSKGSSTSSHPLHIDTEPLRRFNSDQTPSAHQHRSSPVSRIVSAPPSAHLNPSPGKTLNKPSPHRLSSSTCEIGRCERVLSAVVRHCKESDALTRPELARAIIRVQSPGASLDDLQTVFAAAKDITGVPKTPFDGLYDGLEIGNVQVRTVFSPLYLLSTECLIREDGLRVIRTAIETMARVAHKIGCRFQLVVPPYSVTASRKSNDEISRAVSLMRK